MSKAKRIRVIIDTNLFISFLIGKRLKGLKDVLINNQVELIFAEQSLQELKIVAQRPKFNKYFKLENIENLVDLIYSIGRVFVIDKAAQVCRDPKDDFLLELASKGKADYLVTGDNDLLELRSYKNTRIITISEFEKMINAGVNP